MAGNACCAAQRGARHPIENHGMWCECRAAMSYSMATYQRLSHVCLIGNAKTIDEMRIGRSHSAKVEQANAAAYPRASQQAASPACGEWWRQYAAQDGVYRTGRRPGTKKYGSLARRCRIPERECRSSKQHGCVDPRKGRRCGSMPGTCALSHVLPKW